MKILQFVTLLAFLCIGKGSFAQEVSYKTIEDIAYRTNATNDYMKNRCVLDFYYPENVDDFATIIWFHGGGLQAGEKHIPNEFKNQQLAVIAVNYRLSPKAQHPAYLDDAAASVAWAFEHVNEYGGSTDKIMISGHSAGGYLTLMLGLDPKWLGAYDVSYKDIYALFPISGQTITHTTIREEREQEKRHRLADEYSPLFHTRDDAAPLYLITGDRNLEIPARHEESAVLYAYMKSMNPDNVYLYELDGFNHVNVAGPACFLISETVKELLKE